MKKALKGIAAFASIALLAGCASIETNRGGTPLDITCSQDFTPTVKVAEQTIEAEATASSLFFGLYTWGVDNTAIGVDFGTESSSCCIFKGAAETAREGAVYNACVNNNADFLVAPRYTVHTDNYFIFQTVTCKVIGFPGQIIKVTPAAN